MYICMYVYINNNIHMCIYIYIYTYIYILSIISSTSIINIIRVSRSSPRRTRG